MPPQKPLPYQVDACIVSFNTKDITVRAATQLRASTYNTSTQIFVFDNASEDGTQEAIIALQKRNPISLISSPTNLGYGTALNRAFAMGNAPYLLALNSDLEFPHADWLDKLVAYMNENPDVGVVAPLLLNQDQRIGGAGVIGTVSKREIRWWMEPYDKHRAALLTPKECISVCGACMLMRRTAFEDCQGFDENYFFYFEETHLHRLMRVYDWKIVFYPQSKVTHHWNQSPNPGNIKQKYFKDSNEHFNRVWGDGLRIDH